MIRASYCCNHEALVIEFEEINKYKYWTAFRLVMCLKHSNLNDEIISLCGADPLRLYVFYHPMNQYSCILCGENSEKAFCPFCRNRLFISIFEHRKELIRNADEVQKTPS